MKNSTFLKSSFSVLLTLLLSAVYPYTTRAQVTPKYNVLFIALDDMTDRCSFLAGGSEVKTPNLQRLVDRGMVFKLGYSQYSICNPSRTSLLTGWRPDKTQIYGNNVRPRSIIDSTVKFLPEYFSAYGYNVERYGKIMHGDFENDIKWDYAEPPESAFGHNGGGLKPGTPPPVLGPGSDGGTWWINSTANDVSADSLATMDFVVRLKQPRTLPFFYGYGIHAHAPFNPKVNYWNTTGDPSVQQRLPTVSGGDTASSNIMGNGSGNILLPQTPANDRADVPSVAFTNPQIIKLDPEWKNTLHAYDAEVTEMDQQLGLVLDEIDRQNLWANTVVVAWSDQGQHLGEHQGLWLKNTLFEEALHVPLIVCAPGKPAGTSNRLVELVDLYPTLAELCGLPAPTGMEGSSFVKLLDNPTLPWKRAVFAQLQKNISKTDSIMARSVMTEHYRYNSWLTEGEELYNYDNDPHEYTNLVTNPAYADTLASMRKILADGWQKSVPPQCAQSYYADADSDGYGNKMDSVVTCTVPAGYVANFSDCNDADSNVHPGATEICNGVDDNCNGQIDENPSIATITSNGIITACSGSTITLTANSGAGNTYQWLKNGTAISGATSITYFAKKSGDFQVQVSNASGCNSTSATITLTFYDQPTATITPLGNLDICATNSVILQANSGSGLTYQWVKGSKNITGATNIQYTATKAASYKVVVTNSNGCTKSSVNTKVTKSCLAIAANSVNASATERTSKDLILYPNPSKGHITVEYYSKENNKVQFFVYDITGRSVYAAPRYLIKGKNVFSLDLTRLASGNYYVELENGNQLNRVKFIIEK